MNQIKRILLILVGLLFLFTNSGYTQVPVKEYDDGDVSLEYLSDYLDAYRFEGDEFLEVLGKHINAPKVQNLINNSVYKFKKTGWRYTSYEDGITLSFSESREVLASITLYNDGYDEHLKYSGALPANLTFDNTRSEITSRFTKKSGWANGWGTVYKGHELFFYFSGEKILYIMLDEIRDNEVASKPKESIPDMKPRDSDSTIPEYLLELGGLPENNSKPSPAPDIKRSTKNQIGNDGKCVLGYCENDYAKMEWTGEVTYLGDWVDGRPEGFGEYTDADGGKYTGDFKDGYFHGKGKLVTEKIAVDGEFVNGQANGYCKVRPSNGSTYEGYVKDGIPDGRGVQSDGKATYTGGFKNGKWDGLGTLVRLRDNFRLTGYWKNGLKEGEFVIVYPDGTRKVVEFNNDRQLN